MDMFKKVLDIFGTLCWFVFAYLALRILVPYAKDEIKGFLRRFK